jgi:arsenate reductase (thioredoxin)
VLEEIGEYMVGMKKVLFLCTGNSARSQMAEAIVNARLGDDWQAVSAGTHPAGYVHAYALRALAEIGIDHQGRSKSAEEFRGEPFDLVVTVCDDAAQNCPLWLGQGKQVHFGLPDPAKVMGTEDDTLAAFRAVRDRIVNEMPALLRQREGRDAGSEAVPQSLTVQLEHHDAE